MRSKSRDLLLCRRAKLGRGGGQSLSKTGKKAKHSSILESCWEEICGNPFLANPGRCFREMLLRSFFYLFTSIGAPTRQKCNHPSPTHFPRRLTLLLHLETVLSERRDDLLWMAHQCCTIDSRVRLRNLLARIGSNLMRFTCVHFSQRGYTFSQTRTSFLCHVMESCTWDRGRSRSHLP